MSEIDLGSPKAFQESEKTERFRQNESKRKYVIWSMWQGMGDFGSD